MNYSDAEPPISIAGSIHNNNYVSSLTLIRTAFCNKVNYVCFACPLLTSTHYSALDSCTLLVVKSQEIYFVIYNTTTVCCDNWCTFYCNE